MTNRFRHIILLALFPLLVTAANTVDVLVVGGGTGGVAAGIQSARMGAATLIVEESGWLGGMLTSAGVSAVDGNYRLRAGIWGEFLNRLSGYYGGLDKLKTGWVSNVMFDPPVGNDIFHRMAGAESNLTVMHNTAFVSARRRNGLWRVRVRHDGKPHTVYARVIIDATELGDVAKALGVSYDVGMESRHDTGEDIAPEKPNGIIQDLTYVAVLKDYGRDVTIPRPCGYSPDLFACCCDNPLCVSPGEPDRVWSKEMMMSYGRLPSGKIMINWPIEGNDYYVNMIDLSPKERVEREKEAKNRTLCYLYFIQKELGLSTYGLDDETFPTTDRMALMPYHRESRRIHGKVRFTLNHAMRPYDQPQNLYRTCVAVGDYPVDHHHTRYDGTESLPNLYFHPVPSYGVPLGVLVPEKKEGLIVAEKSISVSNIMNGSTRLQPVVLQLGQAAGALAALSAIRSERICDVSVRDVQQAVLDAEGYLLPFLDVEKDSPYFKPLQRIGVTGILRGEGRNVGWSNETWIHADSILTVSGVHCMSEYGLMSVCDTVDTPWSDRPVTVGEASRMVTGIRGDTIPENVLGVSRKYGWPDCNPGRPILRKEFAVMVDEIRNPFALPIDLEGRLSALPGQYLDGNR